MRSSRFRFLASVQGNLPFRCMRARLEVTRSDTQRHDERDGGQLVKRKPDSTVDDDQREADAPESDGGHDRDERVSLYPLSPEEALRALLRTPRPSQPSREGPPSTT